MGRFFYAQIHVIVPRKTGMLPVGECDRIREEIERSLGEVFPRPVADVIFTGRDREREGSLLLRREG